MNKKIYPGLIKITFVLFFCLLFLSGIAAPNTWLGGTTNWSTATNWSTGIIPGTGDDVTIPVTSNNPVLSASTVINSIVINSGASLSLGTTAITLSTNSTAQIDGTLDFGTGAGKTLTIGGSLSGAGTLNLTTSTTTGQTLNLAGATNTIGTFTTSATAPLSTVNYNGAGNQTVFVSSNYRNLNISNSGTKTLTGTGTCIVNNTLSIPSATFSMGSAATPPSLQVVGAGSVASGATFDFGTVSVKTVTFQAGLSVSGTMNMSGAGLAHTLNIAGSSSLTTFTTTNGSGSKVVYNGAAAQFIAPSPNYQNLVLNNPIGVTVLGTTSVVNGNLTISAGTLSGGTGTMTVDGNWINNSTFNGATGTIVLAGTAAQSITGSSSTTFNNLTLNKSTIPDVNIQDNTSVSGTLALNYGVMILGDKNITITPTGTISGTYSNTAMIQSSGSPGPSGELIVQATSVSGLQTTYPVGTPGNYSPAVISALSATLTGTASIGIKPVLFTSSATNYIKRSFNIDTSSISNISNLNVTFSYLPGDIVGSPNSSLVTRFTPAGAYLSPGSTFTGSTFGESFSGSNLGIGGTWRASPPLLLTPNFSGPLCAGQSLYLQYTAQGNFAAGNIFTAEISTSTGVFPGVDIGTHNATFSDSMMITIPAIAAGSSYRIRLRASNPAFTGTDNGSNLIVSVMGPNTVTATASIICVSSSATLNGSTTSGTYQWYQSTSSATGPFTIIPGATSLFYNSTPLNPVAPYSYWFRRESYLPACPTSTSAPAQVNVEAVPTINVQPTNQNGCVGSGTVNFSVFASTRFPSALTYQWKENGTNVLNGGVYSGANTSNFTLTSPGAGLNGKIYSVVLTGLCTPNPTSANATLTLSNPPLPTMATPAAICSGNTATITGTSAAAGIFRWYTAPTLGTLLRTSSTVTADSYTTPALVATTTYYVSLTVATCTTSRVPVTATVNPLPVVSTANTATICDGGTTNIVLASVPTGSTYAWTIGTVTGTTTGQTASSGSTIAQTLTGAGTVDYIVTPTLSGCPGTPYTITVTVNPNPVITTLNTASICDGGTTNIALVSSPTGATFAWTLGTVTGSTTGQTASSGSTIAQTLTGAGSVQYLVTPTLASCPGAVYPITVTVKASPVVTTSNTSIICDGSATNILLTSSPTGSTFGWTIGTVTGSTTGQTANSGSTIAQTLTGAGTVQYIVTPTLSSCPGTAYPITVTINASPVITTANTSSICDGSATNIVLTSSPTGATYSWTIGTVTGSTTGQTASSGSTIAQTLTGVGSVQYMVTPTLAGCSTAFYFITVAVNAVPVITTSNTASVCSGSATNIILTSSPGGATYGWTLGTVTGSTTGQAASSGSAIGQTLTGAGTVQYNVVPSLGSCPGASYPITVTVNASPVVTTSNTSFICSGIATNIVLTSNPTSASFAWTIGTVTGSTTGQTGSSGSTIAQTLTGPGTVQYNVVPTLASCPGASYTITVTVNSSPMVTTSNTASVCSGSATNISLTSSPAGSTYGWTIGTVTGSTTGQTASSGPTIAQGLTGAGTVQYNVVPTLSGCPGTSYTITVSVNASPAMTSSNTANVCSGNSANIILTSSPTGANYSWTLGTVTGSTTGQTASSGSVIGQTLTGAGTVQYNVVPNLAGCPGAAYTIAVTINAVPAVPAAITGSTNPCAGQTGVVYSIPAVTGATSYTWNVPSGSTITAGGNSNSIVVTIGITLGNISVTADNSCGPSGLTNQGITINDIPVTPGPFTTFSNPVCQGDAKTYTLNNDPTVVTYNWSYATGSGASFSTTTNSNLVTFSTIATSGNIQVSATNTCGTSAQYVFGITVNPLPLQPSTINSSSPTSVCQGQSGVSYSVVNDPTVSYNWYYSSGTGAAITPASNVASVDFSNAATSGSIEVTAQNTCGISAASSIAVIVNSLPASPSAFSGASPATVCKGQTGVVYSVVSVAATTYTWGYSVGTGAVITASGTNTASFDFSNAATSGNIDVMAHNSCGSSVSPLSMTVTVNAAPAQPSTIISASTSVCPGQTGVLYSVVNDPLATSGYIWSYSTSGTSITGTSNSVTVNFSNAATAGLLSVQASNGCLSPVQTKSVLVSAATAPILTKTTLLLCNNSPVTLGAGTYSSYAWNLITGGATTIMPGATQQNFTASVPGSYFVTVQSGICFVNSDTLVVSYLNGPPSVSATPVSLIETKLTGGLSSGFVDYQWYANTPSGFKKIQGANVQSYSAYYDGEYIFAVTSNDCYLYSIPYNLTGTAGGSLLRQGFISNDSSIVITAPDLNDKVKVYPNPASTEVNVRFIADSYDEITIGLYNNLGTVLTEKKISGKVFIEETFNEPEIPSGLYHIQIRTKDKSYSKTILISR